MNKNKWVKTFFIGSIVIILMVSGINYIVNPYNVFGHGYDKYFLNKTEILSGEMTTFYVVNRIKPKTIMMGTSRIGFFPETQLNGYVDTPIYNLALAGSSVDEQSAYIKYMVKYHHIKNVIWSLDFFSFNPTKPINSTFETKRLSDQIFWNDYTVSLFNFKTFARSLKTVKSNLLTAEENSQTILLSKSEIESNINATLIEYAREKTFLKSHTFKTPSSINSKIKILKETVGFCRENNVSITLYTSPVYFKHIDLYYSMGLGDTFKYWKKSLANIQPYTDFCTYNSISRNSRMFRDSSHATQQVGNLIFGRIFNPQVQGLPNDFGVLINPENISIYLK